MKITLAATATEKVRLWFFSATQSQPIDFSDTVPDSGSFAKQVAKAPFPIFLTASYSAGTVALGLRLAGFDVPLKSYAVAPSTPSLAVDWSWKGIGLKGMLFLGDAPSAS